MGNYHTPATNNKDHTFGGGGKNSNFNRTNLQFEIRTNSFHNLFSSSPLSSSYYCLITDLNQEPTLQLLPSGFWFLDRWSTHRFDRPCITCSTVYSASPSIRVLSCEEKLGVAREYKMHPFTSVSHAGLHCRFGRKRMYFCPQSDYLLCNEVHRGNNIYNRWWFGFFLSILLSPLLWPYA